MTSTVFETVQRRPVLGLRFRDEVTGEVVRDLRVRLTTSGLAEPADAVRTPSGVYAWRSLPGLVAWALGDDRPAPALSAEVLVSDPEGRYHAYTVGVTVPLADIADARCGSPVESPVESEPRDTRALPLFSLPGRSTPAAMAVVRAALRRADGTPAAYATVQLTAETGETARGVADARGQVAVFLRYPKVARAKGSGPLGSSPFGSRQPLTRMEWDLTVGASVPSGPVGPVPDLCVLLNQTPAQLSTVGTPGHPARILSTATLMYGRDLVLPPFEPRRELLVVP